MRVLFTDYQTYTSPDENRQNPQSKSQGMQPPAHRRISLQLVKLMGQVSLIPILSITL